MCARKVERVVRVCVTACVCVRVCVYEGGNRHHIPHAARRVIDLCNHLNEELITVREFRRAQRAPRMCIRSSSVCAQPALGYIVMQGLAAAAAGTDSTWRRSNSTRALAQFATQAPMPGARGAPMKLMGLTSTSATTTSGIEWHTI